MVAQKRTAMAFEARIKGVKVIPMKESPYGGQREGGGLELTLLLDPPKQPAKPQKGWWARQGRPDVPTEAEEGEDAKAFGKRKAAAEKEVAAYEREERQYAADVEKFNQQAAAVRDRTLAYAQIVGFSAVLADTKVSIRISPANTDLLPGFGVELLEEPKDEPS